jgi:peroxiredoxin
MSELLEIGVEAPDFTLDGVLGEGEVTISLADYYGKKNVLLVFYPADSTPG